MPPKKRPLKKADSVEESKEETDVKPAKIRKNQKNETEKIDQADSNVEPKDRKKTKSKRENELTFVDDVNVVKKRKANPHSVITEEEAEEPVTKEKRIKGNPKKNKDEKAEKIEVDKKTPKKLRERKDKKDKPDEEEKVAKKEPAKKEPTKKESAKKESAKKEPAKKEKDKKEPVKKEKVKKEPAKKEPAKKKENADEVPSNDTDTGWDEINFDCHEKNAEGKGPNLKITSWNVSGLRAWLKKDGMKILKYCSPDFLCLQETKCDEESLPDELTSLEGYEKFWCSSNTRGYAGVGLLTKKKPIKVMYGIDHEEQDEDGRCITAEFNKFYLVTVYVPNAGRKLVTLDKRLDWNEAFKDFIKALDEKKPVIICGDMNVAHNEIDLANPKSNTKNAGFTKEERDGMTVFLEEGFVDTFRALYPDKTGSYTFWTYMMNARKKNVGWRLDYFLVSERIKNKVCDNVIHENVLGSDHCPITLFMNI